MSTLGMLNLLWSITSKGYRLSIGIEMVTSSSANCCAGNESFKPSGLCAKMFDGSAILSV